MAAPSYLPAGADFGPRGDRLFEALGDSTRRRILEHLAVDASSITDLAARLPVSRPAVSKHLQRMAAAGLVSFEVRGRKRIYRLEEQGFEEAKAYLDGFWGMALARFKLAAENLDLADA